MKYIIGFVFLFSLSCCSQNNHVNLGKDIAQKRLNEALSNPMDGNLIDNKTVLIKDEITAIKTVEPILFNIYGEKNITKQKPYETYLLNSNYWVISGTLPENYLGGTFLVILDARNAKIIKIIHGK